MILAALVSISIIALGLVVWLIQKITTKLVMDEIFFQIRNHGYVQKLCHNLIKFAALQHPKEDRQLFFENTVPNTEDLISNNRMLAAMGRSISIVWNTKWSLYILWIAQIISFITFSAFSFIVSVDELSIGLSFYHSVLGNMFILLLLSGGYYGLFLCRKRILTGMEIQSLRGMAFSNFIIFLSMTLMFVPLLSLVCWPLLAMSVTFFIFWTSTFIYKNIMISY